MAYRRFDLLRLSALLALLPGCGDDEPPRVAAACDPDPAGAPLTTAELSAKGPYAVGEMAVTLVDESRSTPAHGGNPELPTRTLDTLIWYPAESAGDDVPAAAGGPFPLVIYSHGFSSYAAEGERLNQRLASHGYVVLSPGFPLSRLSTPGGPTVIDVPSQPGDVSFLITQALAMSAEPGHPLEGAVDGERVAAVGLSMGGLTSLLAGFHRDLRDPRIDVVAAMAPPTDLFTESFYDTRELLLLLVSGTYDAIVPHESNAVVAFARANPPVSFYTLETGTHTGFTGAGLALEKVYANIDELGCQALGAGDDAPDGGVGPADGGVAFDLGAALGGPEAGVLSVPDESLCASLEPTAMKPSRQHELTIPAILSFLDAYLHADPTRRGRACHYHERVLPNEAPEVVYRRR